MTMGKLNDVAVYAREGITGRPEMKLVLLLFVLATLLVNIPPCLLILVNA